MFTGIITAIGTIDSIAKDGDWQMAIRAPWACQAIDMGASIACSGVCLTVIETGEAWFKVAASAETLDLTSISDCGKYSMANNCI